IFALPELAAGTVASLFAVNDADGVGLIALLEGDTTARIAAGESMVRVIHLAPAAPAVDVFANGNETAAVSALEFGASSDFIAVPSAGYDFQVSVSGDSAADAVLSLNGNLLLPGHYYTAVAFDNGEGLDSMVIVDDAASLEEGNLRVRAIHTAAGVGEVDIWNITEGAEPGILWENVPLSAAGQYYDLPAAAYSVGFDVDDDASPDVSFDLPGLPAGTVANVFAVNDGAVKLIAQLWDGTTAEILAQ
ncbi:MAG: DUF4397 domain-containing protein, partial [Deltaproteobacteria bacterium]|nr:DUF4397 domain-containing protein [Deltaproteobacteria bacterium]